MALAAKLLNTLLATAAEPPVSEPVQLVGEDPVLPTRFRLGEAGAATIAAAALQAARLWQERGGREQPIRVDVDAAAAAMRSARYLKVEASEAPRRGDDAMRPTPRRPCRMRPATGAGARWA